MTIRLRNVADCEAVERLKDATGNGTASRAILHAIREWPGLVDELAAERRRVEDLRSALLGIVAAEAALTGAEARRTSALEAATSALKGGDWPIDATLALETDVEATALETK